MSRASPAACAARSMHRAVVARVSRRAEGDVLRDRRREQERLLRRVADERAQRAAAGRVVTSTPPTKIVPGGTSVRRGIASTSVVLPEPVGPTIASVSPAASENETPVEDLAAVALDRQVAHLDRRHQRGRAGARWPACSSPTSAIPGGVARMSRTRCHPT